MKISHAQMNHQPLTTTQSQQSQASAAVTSKKEASATNEPLSEALKSAQQQLAALPDVDMQKVAEIKAAIQNGQIEIDADQIAAAMQKYYRG
ncbi:flagellar biosynthesis anti-sigma factor FlgM [Budvicia aquatica]|nr:flagellar biosynthesis anti-sigma factor FlgM [Budvicia aquatica]MBP9643126.1 flagellar biosynthesis anti-sigma factor FlgM [Budvicia sp.]GKX50184.1 hypothetical protein SOASR029_04930 [Budvicia aquatica]VFS47895.1 anti-sigma28 factor FlgM [Budvicia aquatica]